MELHRFGIPAAPVFVPVRVFTLVKEGEALQCYGANICLGRYNVTACPVKSSVLLKYLTKRSVNWEAGRRLRSDYDM
jgi:hypothetical protein